MLRTTELQRNTTETQISLKINLDGSGISDIQSSIPFFDHMLDLFTRHGLFDVSLRATGDTHIDLHHTVEDIGLLLGQAVREALGDKAGICRYSSLILPMDEALVSVAIDLGGRPYFKFSEYTPAGLPPLSQAIRAGEIPQQLADKIAGIDLELICEFFKSFANTCGANLHIILHYGANLHHIIEGIFKAFGRVLDIATKLDDRLYGRIPSTKGKL